MHCPSPPHRTRGPAAVLLVVPVLAALAGASRASAQVEDARLVPRGLLRIEFAPHYTNYDRRFSNNTRGVPDGTAEFLGTDLTADTAGANLFPALRRAEQAIRDVIGDQSYHINIGAARTVLDADIRRFPFSLSLGLTDRITVTATVPLVTTRMQVDFTVDSATGDAGFNPSLQGISPEANPALAGALLAELRAAIVQVEAQIAGGGFGCPDAPECAAAAATVDRARSLLVNLEIITGIDASGGSIPSFAPLATSTAGAAILAEIAAVAAELAALGATPITASLPLPTRRVGTDDVNGLLASPSLGYDAFPMEFVRRSALGDAEVGVRVGLLQRPSLRALLNATIRLPTGVRDSSAHFVDLGTGDRQTDVQVGFEAAWEPGALGIAVSGSYTLQLADRLSRRAGPPNAPLLPLATEFPVNRNLGDIILASAYPTLRLNEAFRVFGSVHFFHKEGDAYSGGPPAQDDALFRVAELEGETHMETLSFGAGLSYTSSLTPDGRMPIEAGLRYQSAFFGSGGLTPKANQVSLYLRLFYNVFRPDPTPDAEAVPPEVGAAGN